MRLRTSACSTSLIEKHGTDWETVYEEYGQLRKVNTDAIADMAEENFYEMRDAVADPVFVSENANSKQNSNRPIPTISQNTRWSHFAKTCRIRSQKRKETLRIGC